MNQAALPYDLDAESAIIGALLLNFESAQLNILDEHLRAEDFYKQAHQLIYKAVKELNDAGSVVDIITLGNYLRSSDELDKTGGIAYISTLIERAPSSAYLPHYAKIVAEQALRRRLIEASNNISYDAHDQTKDVPQVLEFAEQAIFNLSQGRRINAYKNSQQLIKTTINLIEERKDSKKLYTGVPTRFGRLDDMLSGLQSAEMIIIGARPSIGKTAFALSMLDNIAVQQGNNEAVAAGFFSLEMSGSLLMQRLLSSRSRVDGNRIKRPNILSAKEWGAINDAAALLYDSFILIEDTPNITLSNLRSQARRMKAKEDIKVLFIDYLGLITVEERNLPRHEQMSLVSRSLKGLARELDIPIIVLSQLRRDAEGNEPGLADIRESGSIEQDADVVMFLHRERMNTREDREPDDHEEVIETKLIVAKNRNGPVGTIKMAFIPRYARFENLDY
jgi:replicative DNA helicase